MFPLQAECLINDLHGGVFVLKYGNMQNDEEKVWLLLPSEVKCLKK